MIHRRGLMLGAAGAAVLAGAIRIRASQAAETFAVTHTDDEWRRQLTADQFAVLREAATERPFTSPLLREDRAGLYGCMGCDQDVFSSAAKYDPGEGWPSFWQPLEKAVATKGDASAFMVRTEVHCSRCGGHLGHVFDDGPRPTGLRYCIDGIALKFKPTAA